MPLAGLSLALWALTHPWGTVAGPEVGGSGQWMMSHTFHFTAGLFASVGLLALAPRQFEDVAKLERFGFLVAFVGSVLFTGTGVITAFVWPLLASHAPGLVELSGPFFTPPHPIIGITAVCFSLGFILLAIALARGGLIPRALAGATVLGAVLLIPPPPPLSPVPWIVFPTGGVLMGIGIAGLGVAGRAGSEGTRAV
jgi:hypothetical protein